jgi:hypothetical protein
MLSNHAYGLAFIFYGWMGNRAGGGALDSVFDQYFQPAVGQKIHRIIWDGTFSPSKKKSKV